jgi:2-aminobenzoate-CoA ligase
MKDSYPSSTGIPQNALVPPEAQPDYSDIAVPGTDQSWNVGFHLSDLQVQAGHGDLIAAIHAESGRQCAFAELTHESNRLAAGLIKLGVKLGDRVAYRTVNDPDALVVMLAIWKSGAVMVPVPHQAKPNDIRHFLVDAEPRIMFVHGHAGPIDDIKSAAVGTSLEMIIGFGEGHTLFDVVSWNGVKSDETFVPPHTGPDDIAIIWHTGGTTGKPKGCYHTHKRFLMAGYAYGEGAGVKTGQRWTAAAPIGHALGIIHHTIFSLLHGATAVFVEKYADPEVLLNAVAAHKITTLTALMASWARMADSIRRAGSSADIGSLTRCFAMWQSASAADVFDFWQRQGVELLNNFGSTSFATWVLIPPLHEPSPRSALGKALPGYQVAAVEVDGDMIKILPQGAIGRLAVKGPSGLTYWNLPELQKRDVVDGWTLSDDLIQFDATGAAHYLGRTDYMISTAGYKVAPVEVEEVLSRHPAVREVAVVPGPCPIRQEMVVAYVALHGNGTGDDNLKRELQGLAKSELPSYKSPRRIEFVDELPRDAVGKVQTKIVKDWANAVVPEEGETR